MDITVSQNKIAVTKTARFYTLGNFENANCIWVVLHGYGQLAAYFIRKFGPVAQQFNDAFVAPEALNKYYLQDASRVGATWMTKEDRETEIDDYVNYLNQLTDVLNLNNKKLIGLGFSQGGATLCRWIASGKIKLHISILWAAFFPPDLKLDESLKYLKETDLHLFYGLQDELINESQKEQFQQLKEKYQLKPKEHQYQGKHEILIDELIRFRAQL
jgi:predicted esterase